MRRPRLFLALLGLALSLGIVSGALAMTLWDSGGDARDDRTSSNTAELSTPTPETTPAPTSAAAQPAEFPEDVWARLQALPEKLRDDLLLRFEAGGIGVSEIATVIEEYENRNQGVRVGTVLEATDTMLRLEVYTTGERAEVIINDETVLRRGHDDITAADLERDELVMVLSRDGGVTAFAVTAFGVGAP